ncbi:unnamed protein product [Spirodela intermedia]|uniref:GTD-binding domain-containing protein n=1 Tax=Spirodela intermedia TaxID=51605 RepID=A0A7I8L2H4_SPIIN|nr:unnamed protein product [Spirodela intermedia]
MRSEPESLAPPPRGEACCSCGCVRCGATAGWRRSVKRKVEEIEGSDAPPRRGGCSIHVDVAARVDVENEVAALRDAVARHQKTVADLYAELEQERAASASAATEAMSMILRLQREKADVQMEARQFKRFAEEKMAHDQQELLFLEDLIYKREQSLQTLSCEVQAFRHRLLSHGVDPNSVSPTGGEDDSERDTQYDYPTYQYPLLRCCADSRRLNPNINDADLDKFPPSEIPRRREHLQNLERRILHLERTPSQASLVNEMEKGMVMGSSSPNCGGANHVREFSSDAINSLVAKNPNGKQHEEFPVAFDGSSDLGGDEESSSDRVYTIDAVHSSTPTVRVCEERLGTPRDLLSLGDAISGREETDIQKLYMRLQALEADRESMRHAIMSMGTEKAQLVLLKEIAQQFYREAPPSPPPARKLVKKQSFLGRFSFMSAIKWAISFVFWRKTPNQKAPNQTRYMFDEGRVGLLLLLENSPLWRQQWQLRILPRLRGKTAIGSSHCTIPLKSPS